VGKKRGDGAEKANRLTIGPASHLGSGGKKEGKKRRTPFKEKKQNNRQQKKSKGNDAPKKKHGTSNEADYAGKVGTKVCQGGCRIRGKARESLEIPEDKKEAKVCGVGDERRKSKREKTKETVNNQPKQSVHSRLK